MNKKQIIDVLAIGAGMLFIAAVATSVAITLYEIWKMI